MLGLMLIPGLLPETACAAGGDLNKVDGVYQIEDYADLKAFAKIVNIKSDNDAEAVLMQDIDASEGDWTPIGSFSQEYRGTFNGNGHVITGLSTPEGYDSEYAGLFGYVGSQGKVSSVGLEGGNISGGDYVGGVAGRNEGTVKKCYNTGAVSGNNYVGGVVGSNESLFFARVEDCYNTGAVSGNQYVGGVVGSNYLMCYVQNCYSGGAVSGNQYVCGVIGDNAGRVKNLYYAVYDSYDTAMTAVGGASDSDTVKGLSPDKMTGAGAIGQGGMDFSGSSAWQVKENDAGNNLYYYPHLKGFDPADWPARAHTHKHDGDTIYLAPWGRTDQMPERSGSYYLNVNVVLEDTWTPQGTVNLCLNDHSITYPFAGDNYGNVIWLDADGVALDLYDCGDTTRYYYLDSVGKGHVVASETDDNYANAGDGQKGTFKGGFITGGRPATSGGGVRIYGSGCSFTMNGGTIIGNEAAFGGGVNVSGLGNSFTMNGGAIIGNAAADGGGVEILQGADFTMNGGNIINNIADNHGGGVYLATHTNTDTKKVSFHLSGASVIIGNKAGKSVVADDVWLKDEGRITITGKLRLPDGASTPQIGIMMKNAGVFTNDYSKYNTEEPDNYFKNNEENSDYVVAFTKDKTEARLTTLTIEGVSSLTGDDSLTYGYAAGSAHINVTAEVAPRFEASYQWYSCNAQGEEGAAIDTAKEPTAATAEYMIPAGENTGDHYYFCRVTATRADGKTATADSEVAIVTVNKADPTIDTAPTASAIAYGQSLADSRFSGGLAKAGDTEIPGTFAWTDSAIKPTVSDSGKTEYEVTFTPNDTRNYKTATTKITLTVNKADITPTVSIQGWSYGSEANRPVVDGNTGGGAETFWYREKDALDSPYTQTVPADAGQYTIRADIAETENYSAGSATFDFSITQAQPAIETVPTASAITEGQTLADSILSDGIAKAGDTVVPGTFSWTDSTIKPTVSDSGNTEYEVTFTPADAKNYSTVTFGVTLTINKKEEPVIPPDDVPVDPDIPVVDTVELKTVGNFARKEMKIFFHTDTAVTKYQIQYRMAGETDWQIGWSEGTDSYTFRGLDKSSLCEFRIAGFVALEDGSWVRGEWSDIAYRYMQSVKLKSAKAGKKRIKLTWAKDKKGNGYQIKYYTDKSIHMADADTVTIKGKKKTKCTIRHLKKGQTYYVRIRPIKIKGGIEYIGILKNTKKARIK